MPSLPGAGDYPTLLSRSELVKKEDLRRLSESILVWVLDISFTLLNAFMDFHARVLFLGGAFSEISFVLRIPSCLMFSLDFDNLF